MRYGHGDLAAQRSLLDLPDIDLPCPLFMILPDLGYAARFLAFSWLVRTPVSRVNPSSHPKRVTQTVGRQEDFVDQWEGAIVITIRRLQLGEADLFKQVRLMALQEAPYAFPSTYTATLQRSAESWQEQADRSAAGPDRATFIAFSNDLPIGMAALYRDEDKVNVGELLQVWISPEYRGKTVTRDLMDIIFKWAGENNFRKIIAGVTKGNARALKFYIKYGFSIMEESSDGVYLVKEVKYE